MSQRRTGATDNDLLNKFLFTLFALAIFRLGAHIPTPGVDTQALANVIQREGGSIVNMLNMFSGGALSRFSIFALGVMPYISASIVMQLMAAVVPALEQMQKEGGSGRVRMNKITRTLAFLLALVQGYTATSLISGVQGANGESVVLFNDLSFKLLTTFLLGTGTVFVMWLGEQITEKGIGNGISLLIFSGIVVMFPDNVIEIAEVFNQTPILGLVLVAVMLITIGSVAFVEQSYRKVPIHYARRSVGNRVMSSQTSYLPLKVNMGGVMPAIFAGTILSVPLQFNLFTQAGESGDMLTYIFSPAGFYYVLMAALVLMFCYVYTSLIFKPDDMAENLKKQNAFIPGIRPGQETSTALTQVVGRLTLVGAIYMNMIIILPQNIFDGGNRFSQQVFLSGTSLLIVVGVALDTIQRVTAQLAQQQYDGLLFPDEESNTGPAPTNPSRV